MLLLINGAVITCEVETMKDVAVHAAYMQEDQHFFSAVHKRGGTMRECIDDTLQSMSPDSVMYTVRVNGQFAGFFAKAVVKGYPQPGLEGFHIIPRYRHRWFTEAFWQIVQAVFGGPMFTAIYEKNTPALRHLQDVGFQIVRHFVLGDKKYHLLTWKS